MSTYLTLSAIIIAALIYFAGVQRGKISERKKADNDRELEMDRRIYERKSKLVDEYVAMVDNHRDSGVHALARLGLDQLGSDSIIRDAIEEMRGRTTASIWGGDRIHIENIDLVEFFRYVRQKKVNFFRESVEETIAHMQKAK